MSLWFALVVTAIASILHAGCGVLKAQEQSACGANGYRVVARHWDAVLNRGWESREECAHPGWPLRLVEMASGEAEAIEDGGPGRHVQETKAALKFGSPPLLVKAGETVRVWMQGDRVRIEMAGTVERSAHEGERVVVLVVRRDDEGGLTVQRITGAVSGAEEVEIEQ